MTQLLMLSNYIELAHRRPLFTAVLIQPLSANRPRQHCTIHGTIALEGRVPILIAYGGASLVDPDALRLHVIDAQPDFLIGPNALAHVVVQLVVLVEREGGAERATLGDAVLAGRVVALL